MRKIFEENTIHLAFDIMLIFKGIFAILEIVGGIVAYFITQKFLLKVILAITQDELTEEPHDAVACYLIQTAKNFSLSTQHFTAFYLVSHGAIKIVLIAGLLRRKLSIYPLAIIVFVLFILYQLFRFSFTHSVWLLALTLVDLIVIWLTWHEFRFLRKRQ